MQRDSAMAPIDHSLAHGDGAPRVHDRARGTVLLADPQDDLRSLVARVLADRGYDVLEASTGEATLQLASTEQPNLILLEPGLPDIHGFDVCKRIKQDHTMHRITVIVVSSEYCGWRFAEDLREALHIDGVIEKPFKVSTVIRHIEHGLAGDFTSVESEQDILPDDLNDILNLGLDAYQKGDLNTAVIHLQKGIELDPSSFTLHYHLGLLQGRREHVLQAIAMLEVAVGLRPRNFAALKNLAVLYQRVGFRRKATELWERALVCAPDVQTRDDIREHLVGLL